MLKFHEIVLRKFLALFFVLSVIIGSIVYFWEYDFYLENTKKSLLQDIQLITLQINKDTDLDKLVQQVKEQLGIRITIIDADGIVIAESHKDKTQMENHRYREEIMQADLEEYGFKKRHSNTLNLDLLYVAKKYTIQEKTIYVRMAVELRGIIEKMLQLALKIFSALTLFFIAIFYVTYKINSQVEHEVSNIINFLKSMVKKQKSTFIQSEYSQEFALITKLLTKVSQIIVKQEKKKSKYTNKLKDLNKQKDDIISAISHEFKNPIAIVNGYSQTLLEDPNINQNIRQKFLTKIHNNGTKLSELIDTLRLSLKLDSHQQSLKVSTFSLGELLEDCAENIKINYPGREILINGPKEQQIHADPTMMSIVFSNLIENAIKYSEDEVVINFDHLHIDIIDTGIGISQKDLENITSKFYRVHKNTWNNSLGLGLFLVDNIIKLHSFKLTIASEENKGSTFTIHF
ncbi:ATP-binding protein [Sulfurimonas sp. C5]|uniref:sensor histidine kinase n=1 Tax=Sulfurimonas sp. C5 TaxID=3036947 RepID=UPI00245497F1|nr:ATP-binding protein [Sulfurimonas sp. C5]MDH4944503.1 ATP-binding protein [Sulfurimonas sp. C5]